MLNKERKASTGAVEEYESGSVERLGILERACTAFERAFPLVRASAGERAKRELVRVREASETLSTASKCSRKRRELEFPQDLSREREAQERREEEMLSGNTLEKRVELLEARVFDE